MPQDRYAPRPVTGRERLVEGMKWDVVADDFTLEPPEGQDVDPVTVRREYLEHPGAVSVLAMDDDERVLLLRQYRHPVRHELWELPAGLLDLDGEEPLLAAERELWEEVDLRAGRYDLLVDFLNSPGGSDEAQRVFLARDVQVVPETERFTRENEEAGIITAWVPLDEAVADVLAGRIQNPGAVIALLAADAARRAGWSTLRPVDSPWPMHPTYRPAPRGTDAPST
ncbi:NUDIX domain-containing protein [Aquipuribacter sp. MA13-6]|uniref:NUDIX domain-containing protein n=1 Tax=Aquipuribacter sp. MA13-6 TaxID=3440839 RepID=UPI003EEC425C